jgi:hypothetical protein
VGCRWAAARPDRLRRGLRGRRSAQARGLGGRRLQSFARVALAPARWRLAARAEPAARPTRWGRRSRRWRGRSRHPARACARCCPTGSPHRAAGGGRRRARSRRVRALPPGVRPAVSRREAVVQAERVGDGRVLAAVAWRTRDRRVRGRPSGGGLGRGAVDLTPLAALRPVADAAASAARPHRPRRRRVLAGAARRPPPARRPQPPARRTGDEASRLAREVERAARQCRCRTACACGSWVRRVGALAREWRRRRGVPSRDGSSTRAGSPGPRPSSPGWEWRLA